MILAYPRSPEYHSGDSSYAVLSLKPSEPALVARFVQQALAASGL